ncbi:MAG: protein-tyrosine phosphatase, partial [Verrucomicrobiales bacterium]
MRKVFHQIPIRDVSIPTVDHIKVILDVIDASLSQNRPVYVHCRGGIGRTGLVVGCFLQRHGLSDAHNVLELIALLRRNDPKASTISPETPKQREFVINWERAVPADANIDGTRIREGMTLGGFKIRSLIGEGG